MSEVSLEVSDGIAVVTLDNPPVNAIHRGMFQQLIDAFESFGTRRDVRAAIFTATGERAFMAGADVKRYATDRAAIVEGPPRDLIDTGLIAREALSAVYHAAVPVICAVNGPAIGAGLAFASCCDVIVAAEGVPFAVTEINVGLLGAGRHLMRMVGQYKARLMYFSGEMVPAEELYRRGVVERVVPRAELLSTAREIASVFAAKSPIALRLAKQSLNRVEFMPLEDGYRTEQDYTQRLNTFDDAKEAQAAFAEKRPGVWKWR